MMIKENELPDGWSVKPFIECIEKEATANKLKIPKNNFQDIGEYAIIDQGAKYIAGYTDDSSKVYKGNLPIIIFGDHTRFFKFIDFQFALGADGTKILVPKKSLFNPKYLYYFLNRLKIEDHGYSRHYKFLKEKQIIVPPLPTQAKIVAILEKAERLRDWRSEADELTDEFLKSTFLEMFGDLGINGKEWDVNKLKNCIEIPLNSGWSPICSDEIGGIPVFSLANLKDNGLFSDINKYYYGNDPIKGFDLDVDDIVISRSNTRDLVGRAGRYKGNPEKVIYPDLLIRIRVKRDILNPVFFEKYLQMNSVRKILQGLAHGSSGSMVKISQKNLVELPIIIPSLPLQQKFADIVQQVEQMRTYQNQSRQHITDLFNVLMQKAFRGGLLQ